VQDVDGAEALVDAFELEERSFRGGHGVTFSQRMWAEGVFPRNRQGTPVGAGEAPAPTGFVHAGVTAG
jgi:hypothetical protein